MPEVRNRRTTYRRDGTEVYVGRPSKWGNPFEIGKDGTREQVVEKYRQWISGRFHMIHAYPVNAHKG